MKIALIHETNHHRQYFIINSIDLRWFLNAKPFCNGFKKLHFLSDPWKK